MDLHIERIIFWFGSRFIYSIFQDELYSPYLWIFMVLVMIRTGNNLPTIKKKI